MLPIHRTSTKQNVIAVIDYQHLHEIYLVIGLLQHCFTFITIITVSLYSNPVLLDFSLTVKAATLIFISGCGSAISSAKQGKSGSIYNFGKALISFWTLIRLLLWEQSDLGPQS